MSETSTTDNNINIRAQRRHLAAQKTTISFLSLPQQQFKDQMSLDESGKFNFKKGSRPREDSCSTSRRRQIMERYNRRFFLLATMLLLYSRATWPTTVWAFSKTGASTPLSSPTQHKPPQEATSSSSRSFFCKSKLCSPNSFTAIYKSTSENEEGGGEKSSRSSSQSSESSASNNSDDSSISIANEISTDCSDNGNQRSFGNPRQTRRLKIATGLVVTIAVMAVAASVGLLPGPLLENSVLATKSSFQLFSYPGCGPYTGSMIVRDSIATALAAVLAVVLVKGITYGKENGYYNSKVGRKLNHTLAAPLFIFFFPAFSNAEGARFFASLVSTSNILRLYLAGTGQGESSLASTISRSGDKSEVLGGPFIYVLWLQAAIWCFWRSSFVGVVAMATMAAGDGMADLVGRRWGANNKWSFSDGSKSKVGTLAFGVSAFLVNFGLCEWLIATGCLESSLGMTNLALRLVLISFVTAFVELIPFGDDNYTVPGCAALMAALLLH